MNKKKLYFKFVKEIICELEETSALFGMFENLLFELKAVVASYTLSVL